MKARQLQLFIVRPVLEYLGPKFMGLAAERLVVGTALAETHGDGLDQITGPNDETMGPAFGLWQIEPGTEQDVWENFLRFEPVLDDQLKGFLSVWPGSTEQLVGNLNYAAAMCRLIYYRDKEPLPDADDLEGLAKYYKRIFNTDKGKATIGGFCLKAHAIMELD